MIKASYGKHPSVIAGLHAAEAWRQAANLSRHYEIKNGKKLIDFYRQSMRSWALHSMSLHKILSTGTK